MIAVNKYQTSINEERLNSLHPYVKEELIDAINRIEFVQKLISPTRPYAKDLPRWNNPFSKNRKETPNGRIHPNYEEPHILENMDYFRAAAIHFEEHNRYTFAHPSKHPNSEYQKFWKEEERRCTEGLIREEDGEWITGYNYYYWNYSPIMLAIAKASEEEIPEEIDSFEGVSGDRIEDFPKPWDMDYFYYHYLEEAEQSAKYGTVLKTRGRGYSFKGGSLLGRNFNFFKRSKSWAFASDKGDLTEDGLLSKAWDNLDYINEFTAWKKRRSEKNTMMHKRASYLDLDKQIYKGYKSEIMGITTQNKPEKARGKRGKVILLEEAGRYLDLLKVWGIARPSMEQGSITFGLMIAFGTGGCLTGNNKVWTIDGNLINIKDIKKENGIVGFDVNANKISKEPISYWQPPMFKECLRITTNTRRTIECSLEHPLLKITQNKNTRKLNIISFEKAEDLNVNEYIAIADEVSIFGNLKMWNPRLIGLLIGDGSYSYNNGVSFSNCDKEVLEYVEDNFDTKVRLSRLTKENKVYKELGILGIRPELRKLGIINQTLKNKTLPENTHLYSKEDLQELIAGFYDADGYVNIRTNKKRNTPIAEISLSSCSEELLNEVRFVLQKFGVHGRIRERLPNLHKKGKIQDKNAWYELVVADKVSLIRFVDNFKLLCKHKQEKLIQIRDVYKSIKKHSKLEGVRREKIISIESVGVKRVYNLTADKTNTYLGNGIITHNTQGAAFEGLEKLFYEGGGFRVHMKKNVFDKTSGEGMCAFYCGEYMNREFCYDKDGNSDVTKALIEVFYSRLEVLNSTTESTAIVQEKADRSITPQEAVMRTEGTIFPISDLKDYLAEIKPREDRFVSAHFIGRLGIVSGMVDFIYDKNQLPLRNFPANAKKDKSGAIEIYAHPKKVNGEIQSRRYIIGVDPYDDDTGTSLGSAFVFDLFTDRIVAEYTGRPKFANDFYEIVRRLALYYNAVINYENNNKGLFGYFNTKNALHLLADNPRFLKDTDTSQSKETYGNKAKGTRANKEVNALGRRLQKDWMLSEAYTNDEEGLLNIHKIRSIAYIEELIAWNPDGNFDRVSAMGMVMIQREEMLKYLDTAKEEKTSTGLGEDNFWKNNY